MNDTIDFSDSILGNTKLTINSATIASEFTLNYNFCVTDSECYPSVEILKPAVVNNYDKTLIKFDSQIIWGDNTAKGKTTNLFKFIDLYGTFKYVINNSEKNDITSLKQVNSVRVNENNIYYVEAIKEIENASSISIVFKVRDYIYIYKII